MACLVVQRTGRKSQVFELKLDCTVVGRGKDSGLLLPDISVSRSHCEIVRKGDRFILNDLGSQNGTMVNRKPVKKTLKLSSGDQVHVGKFVLVFQEDAVSTATSAAQPGALGEYELTDRVGFLERVSATGEDAASTTHLSKDDVAKARKAMRARETGELVRVDDTSKRYPVGVKGVRFGADGVPAKGMGIGGGAVVLWRNDHHYIKKTGGLFMTLKVNGHPVKGARLKAGDKLVVGKTLFLYQTA